MSRPSSTIALRNASSPLSISSANSAVMTRIRRVTATSPTMRNGSGTSACSRNETWTVYIDLDDHQDQQQAVQQIEDRWLQRVPGREEPDELDAAVDEQGQRLRRLVVAVIGELTRGPPTEPPPRARP